LFTSADKKEKTEDVSEISETVMKIKQGDLLLREDFILEHKQFILTCVSNYKQSSIFGYNSDEFSIALIAFNEAINTYNDSKGMAFLSFARMVIYNRLNDYSRKTKNDKNLISLELDKQSYDIPVEDHSFRNLEVKDEIAFLTKELQRFRIRFKDLVKISPKQAPTREKLLNLAQLIYSRPYLMKKLKYTKQIPIKEILEISSLSRRTIELNRKYIIAIILILDSDLDTIKGYIIKSERGEYNGN